MVIQIDRLPVDDGELLDLIQCKEKRVLSVEELVQSVSLNLRSALLLLNDNLNHHSDTQDLQDECHG